MSSGEGLHRPDLSVGNGIYKSTDAGKTWTHLGLADGQQIPALAVDPRDPNRVFAAVLGHPYGPSEERGIYRSTDGGQTWQRVISKDENTGGSDVEIDPSNPDVVYASMWEVREGPWEDGNEFNGTGGGLFKSTDGGSTWHPLTNGLPKDLSQIYVAIAPSDPRRLYATLADSLGKTGRLPLRRRRRDLVADHRPIRARRAASAAAIFPSPRSIRKIPTRVYVVSTVTMRSTDGGKTWSGFRGAPGGDDYQNLWINPNNGNIILLVSDQGAIVTVNGGASWSSWYNQPTAQLYHAIADNTFPYRVCARTAGERLGLHLEPRQRRRHHLSRLASRGRDRVWLRRARSARPRRHLRRRPNRSLEISLVHRRRCRTSRRFRCATRNTAPTAPSR